MKKFTNVIRWIGVAVFGIMAIDSLGSGGCGLRSKVAR